MNSLVAITFLSFVAARPDGQFGHHGVHHHQPQHHQLQHHQLQHHQPQHHHSVSHHAVHPHQPVTKEAPQTIAELVVSDPRFSTLLAAVKAAGLVETLSGAGPFTVFAPTNAAFQKVSYYDFLMIERLTDD